MLLMKRRNAGFTLVEMSLSTMILSLASLTVAAMMVYGLRAWTAGTTQDAVTGAATIALQKLSNDIRDGVQAEVSGSTLVVTFPGQVTDLTTGETTYESSGANQSVRYYFVSGGNLVRRVGSVDTVIGRGVTEATFGASGGTVTATLKATENAGTAVKTMEVTGRVSLRNFRT